MTYPADWDVRFPDVSVVVDAQEHIIWATMLDNVELGRATLALNRALVEGDWDYVDALPFTGRIYKRRGRPGISPAVKAQVLAEGACRVCGSADDLEVDHIIAWSNGGTHDLANLQPLCRPCNRDKGTQTMAEWARG